MREMLGPWEHNTERERERERDVAGGVVIKDASRITTMESEN